LIKDGKQQFFSGGNNMAINQLIRREFLKVCAKAGVALAVGKVFGYPFPNSSFAAVKDKVLKIGYIPITDATPLLIAYSKGFYSQEGIKAEKPVLIRGWSTLSEAFMAKKFNLVHLLLPIPIYMRYNLNFPVKVVAWDHLNNSAITVGAKTALYPQVETTVAEDL
jgi:ABC-type nitrate/sulfonate/bicarbonate transport systems, periplasmic components